MRKEIILRVIIEGETIGSVIQKSGFDSSLSSWFEITGILQKIVDDEKEKIAKRLKTTSDYMIKEPMKDKDKDKDKTITFS